MPGPFPAIEPFDEGFLDVGDGHLIWWERSGDPEGKPFVALHGGPGSGLSPGRRRWFDPDEYQLIQFDQRGCGRSTPSASDPFTDLGDNTTHHLIGDIEKLRMRFGLQRWFVWGASWGATLGLAYAQRFPQHVRGMILLSVTMSRRSDVHWLYHQAGRFFPEEWARFKSGADKAGARAKAGEDLVAAYNYLLNEQPDIKIRQQAAENWCAWEDAVLSLEQGWSPSPRFQDSAFRMQFARLCAHYFSNGAWLREGELLDNAYKLNGIPGVLIHGRFDIGGPPDVPWLLARAWKDADLKLVKTGHTGGSEMDEEHLAALAPFAGL